MSYKFNEPWTSRESIELLLNILQGQNRDPVPYLVQLVQDNRQQLQWNTIALPQGRSVRDCEATLTRLTQQTTHPQSFYHLQTQFPASFPPAASQHRLYGEHTPIQPQPAPRPIQPRLSRSTDSPNPASTNGEALTIVRTAGPEQGPDRPKKRGRPTKEEVEERTAILAAEGKVYEPKKRASKKFRASTGTPIPVGEQTPTSPILQTPLPQTIEAKEDSSSGKRRSKRQTSLIGQQTQAEPMSPTTRVGEDRAAAESPSDRLLHSRWNPPDREPDRPPGPASN